MVSIFSIIIGITLTFFVLLIFKELLPKRIKEKFCVLCITITLAWITLLILIWLKIFDNLIFVALLIGQTILGVFYLIENKVRENLKVFQLPFLLTLIILGYSLLNMSENITNTIMLLFFLWIFFILIYIFKNNNKMNVFVKKLVECCKRW